MSRKALTEQQQKVMSFLGRFIEENGFPPTLREIGESIRVYNLNAVRGHLLALEKKGYITKSPDKARAIQVVDRPSTLSRMKRRLHGVLGTDKGVFHQVVYGLAWTTWRRTPYFTGLRRERLSRILDREAVERGWTIMEKRIEPDCVVAVIATWPSHSPQRTVRRLQSVATALKRRYPKEFPGERLWGFGYVATTDLDLLDELVAKLRENQPTNDKEKEGSSE